MIIGIDFDDTINNLLQHWIEELNRIHNLHIQFEDIIDWTMSNSIPELTDEQICEPLFDPEFWNKVSIKKDAAKVIENWKHSGHDVVIVTNTHYKTAGFKFTNCLFKHLSFLTPSDIICASRKDLLKLDVMIDDNHKNFGANHQIKILMDMPHNRTASNYDFRVTTWEEIDDIINQLLKVS